ncbi:heavy metal-binding protein HIP-like [Mercenaria mercenaria]|uniref:heavy metal-binding protein HIP-like n=1 Tax=Mercenaria mercenaria TaxID=6596 RepID=UPI00234E9E36|nr:heavy metal-binding protein HIP-like [Mercenaria mercenaria]
MNSVVLFLSVLARCCVNSLVLEQQTDQDVLQLLVKLEAKVTTLEDKIRVLEESGISTKKEPSPAFMATLSHRVETCATDQPLIFDNVRLNIGSGYDQRHGLFRAPRNGTYQISATLTATPNTQYHVAFVKNMASNHVGYLFVDNISIWLERSTSLVMHLNAGDDIWLSCIYGNSAIHGYQTGKANDYDSHFQVL